MEIKKGASKPNASPFRLFSKLKEKRQSASLPLKRLRELFKERRSPLSLGPWCPISTHILALFLGSLTVSPYESIKIIKLKSVLSPPPRNLEISKSLKQGVSQLVAINRLHNCILSQTSFKLRKQLDGSMFLVSANSKNSLKHLSSLYTRERLALITSQEAQKLTLCSSENHDKNSGTYYYNSNN